jgi:hypothetical protein
MMEHAEAWLRARGAVKLNLMIRHTNAPAVGFSGSDMRTTT